MSSVYNISIGLNREVMKEIVQIKGERIGQDITELEFNAFLQALDEKGSNIMEHNIIHFGAQNPNIPSEVRETQVIDGIRKDVAKEVAIFLHEQSIKNKAENLSKLHVPVLFGLVTMIFLSKYFIMAVIFQKNLSVVKDMILSVYLCFALAGWSFAVMPIYLNILGRKLARSVIQAQQEINEEPFFELYQKAVTISTTQMQ